MKTRIKIEERKAFQPANKGELRGWIISEKENTSIRGDKYKSITYVREDGVIERVGKFTGDGNKFKREDYEQLQKFVELGTIRKFESPTDGSIYCQVFCGDKRYGFYPKNVNLEVDGREIFFMKKKATTGSGKLYAVEVDKEFAELIGGTYFRDVVVEIENPVDWIEMHLDIEAAPMRSPEEQPELEPKKLVLDNVKDEGYTYITKYDKFLKTGGNKINADEANRRHLLNEEAKELRTLRSSIFKTQWHSNPWVSKMFNLGILQLILPKTAFKWEPNDGGYDTRDARKDSRPHEMSQDEFLQAVEDGHLSWSDADKLGFYTEELADEMAAKEEQGLTVAEACRAVRSAKMLSERVIVQPEVFETQQTNMKDYFEISIVQEVIKFNDVKADDPRIGDLETMPVPECIKCGVNGSRIFFQNVVTKRLYLYIHKTVIQTLRSVNYYSDEKAELDYEFTETSEDVRDYEKEDYPSNAVSTHIMDMAPDELLMMHEDIQEKRNNR